MCHQSVGLVQHELESAGIASASVTLKPEITYGVGASRAAWVRFPLGHPMGEPDRPDLQREILTDLLHIVSEYPNPLDHGGDRGLILRLPYRWRRS